MFRPNYQSIGEEDPFIDCDLKQLAEPPYLFRVENKAYNANEVQQEFDEIIYD